MNRVFRGSGKQQLVVGFVRAADFAEQGQQVGNGELLLLLAGHVDDTIHGSLKGDLTRYSSCSSVLLDCFALYEAAAEMSTVILHKSFLLL